MAGIYVHIPFCKRKCGYCDFYSCARPELHDEVLAQILRELHTEREFIGGVPIHTIYFGGGTPSLYSPRQLQSVVERVKVLWNCTAEAEITAEANPDDLTPEYLRELAQTDINRLSIGIQSFIDRDLRFMNRRHSAKTAIDAVRNAQKEGFANISIDLIYGIPGMSAGEWESNIREAVNLGVQHISAYHLIIEEDTPFGRRAAAGTLSPIDEKLSEEQYLALHEMLTQAGYEHYEISNFARRGFRSQHNSSYWQGVPYLGVGPSAHSFDGSVRRSSPPSVEEYLSPQGFAYATETLSETDRYNEFVMTSLRTAEGLDSDVMEERFGREMTDRFRSSAKQLTESELLTKKGGRYAIPPEKFLVSDSVITTLFIE